MLIFWKPHQPREVWSGPVWPGYTFVYFLVIFYSPGCEYVFVLETWGDRNVTVGLNGDWVNSSSVHVQPESPPSSWVPTPTPNLPPLQKFLWISDLAMKSLILLKQLKQPCRDTGQPLTSPGPKKCNPLLLTHPSGSFGNYPVVALSSTGGRRAAEEGWGWGVWHEPLLTLVKSNLSNRSSRIWGVGHISGRKMKYWVSELWGRELSRNIKIALQLP